MKRRFTFGMSVLVALSMIATACGDDTTPPPAGGEEEEPTQVGLVYDLGGRGDQSFNDAAARGIDQAKAEFNIEVKELEPNAGGTNRGELLRLLSEQEYPLIIAVGFAFAADVGTTSQEFPDVHYADVDGFIDSTVCEGCPDLDADSNVTSLLFAEEQGSFLVGAAAALKSETGKIGFIGGVDVPLIHKFEAGYEAGAREINPDIEIAVTYISQPPDFSGFGDPAKGKEIATGMYNDGADVVYHAAGGSGAGLFTAAKEASAGGTPVWAIGVDSDQYLTAPPDEQPYILTSMLKKVDVAVYESIKDFLDGNLDGGYRTFDLSTGGIDYSTSGGHVDDIKDQLDELKQQIIDGEITVPTS